MDDRSSIPASSRDEIFSPHYRVRDGSAAHPTEPPIQWILAVISAGVKQPGVEADHSPHLVPTLSIGGDGVVIN